MGMVFIFWDKLFGTYQEEQEEVRYGLTKNIETYHPIKMVFHEWINIYKDCTQPNLKLKHRFMYVFGPPGWSHDGRSLTSVQMREELEQGKKANQ